MNGKVVVIVVAVLLSFMLGMGSCVNSYSSPQPTDVTPSSAPQTPSMPATTPETAPQTTATPAMTTTATPVVPSPPKIPQEVLSIWNLQPPSDDSPADLKGTLSLKPNPDTAETEATKLGNISISVLHTPWQDTPHFQLKPNQWIDVIVSSLDVPVYYFAEQPGIVSFQLQRIYQEPGKEGRQTIGGEAAEPVGEPEDEQFSSLAFAVLSGKRLYENRATNTQEGIVFTSAYRLFTGVGSGEFADADYIMHFSNFNHQRSAEITYRLYRLDTTPNWGEAYSAEQLQPWFNELYEMSISGKISDDEYREAENQWLRQFPD